MGTIQNVEVSQDALGFMLVWSEDGPGGREGEPLGAPDYYKSRAAAHRASRAYYERQSQKASDKRIVHRALDAARRELYSMTSELEHYGDQFNGPQLAAMRKVIRALREYIKTLEA